jgi:hypothetical protein
MVPWALRNAEVLHAFVPVTTEGGYTLAGQYNATPAAPEPLQSVWQIPLIVPDVAARLRPCTSGRAGSARPSWTPGCGASPSTT